MNYHTLSDEVQKYALSFFEAHSKEQLLYHNVSHTKGVVSKALLIGNHYKLTEHDLFVVSTAAWFHDLGYYFNDGTHHEEKGVGMAAKFLEEAHLDKEIIAAVKNCILATKMPQNPRTLLEQIVCDADLFHLGTEEFMAENSVIHKEVEQASNTTISEENWYKSTIQLMMSHHYHTTFCASLLNKKKQENLEMLLVKQRADK
jgi:predicted metal-dependent HD superfamily phosphohydrolase